MTTTPSLLVAFFLEAFIQFSRSAYGCKCESQMTQQEAMCAAGWIIHVKILNKTQVNDGPHHLIDYFVEETIVASIDPDYIGDDPLIPRFPNDTTAATTPALMNRIEQNWLTIETAASWEEYCGLVSLEEGKEYLLAGHYSGAASGDNFMDEPQLRRTSTCSQIPQNAEKTNGKNSAIEWANVGPVLTEMMAMKANGSLPC